MLPPVDFASTPIGWVAPRDQLRRRHELRSNVAGEINWVSLRLGIAVKASKIIDTKIGEKNTGKTDEAENSNPFAPPTPYQPRVDHSSIDKPGD
jgi:hypothetical protein